MIIVAGIVNRTLGTHYTIDEIQALPPEIIEATLTIANMRKE